ncbi:MAG: tyrosine-type recombinase/integrase, partial [Pseudomonadota bacterium]
RLWRHKESGLSWLAQAPLIQLENGYKRAPYPLSWSEQETLFAELVDPDPYLYLVNTGTRTAECMGLRWSWEQRLPELGTFVFVVPGDLVKNTEPRLIVHNSTAREIVDRQRGRHPEFVFSYRGKQRKSLSGNGFQRARERAKLDQVRVHDLKHTYGRRLRAAGVSREDRRDLLGHKSQSITTHYSTAEIGNLIAASEKVVRQRTSTAPATLLRCIDGGRK